MPVDRRDLRRRLFNWAAEQGGYFSAGQAKEIGYSYQAQAHHVGAGNWLRIGRGLFRLAEWVPDLHDDLARWTLWSRGRGVVSHETALAMHGIGEFESARVHHARLTRTLAAQGQGERFDQGFPRSPLLSEGASVVYS